jgi:isopropylmalate/homocitrate/citramalate synthase
MTMEFFAGWNEAPPFAAPQIWDNTLQCLGRLPSRRELRQWLELVRPLGVTQVCVGSVGPRDWDTVESLAADSPGDMQLEFDLDLPRSGLSCVVQQPELAWRVVLGQGQCEQAVRRLCGSSSSTTVVLPEAVCMDPLELSRWLRKVEDWGARRIEFVGTHGCPWGAGVESLLRFALGLGRGATPPSYVWSGVAGLGVALAQAIHAYEAGAAAVRGTFGGAGGSVPLESLLVHLMLEGLWPEHSLQTLCSVGHWLEVELGVDLPPNHPVLGSDAFRTATGVHAAAIVKAEARHRPDWADAVYSAVPAARIGRQQCIEVGPLSGKANVQHWLKSQQLHCSDELAEAILAVAKDQQQVLTDLELVDIYYTLNGAHPC